MSDGLVLAIDTSFGPVAATLMTMGREKLGRIEADNPSGQQAETLPPIVAKLLEGHDVKRLVRVAVTVGPGAFTGVRVGLAFAKGLRLATKAAVMGFTTLECMAAQAAHSRPCASVGVAIDARRGEVYAQAFSNSMEPLSEAAVLPVADAALVLRRLLKPKMLVIGSGVPLLDGFGGAETVPFQRIDTELLARRAALVDDLERYPATPAYLRAPDAKLPT